MKMLNGLHRQTVAFICAFDRSAPPSKASCKSRSAENRVRARLCMDEEGSNLVEFALVLPILLLFLMGIFWFGTALSSKQALSQAVGMAAVQLSESRSTSKDPCTETLTALENAAPQLKPANLTVTITMNGVKVPANSACAGDQSDLQLATPGSVTVKATYPFAVPSFTVTASPPWFKMTMTSISLTETATEYEN